MSVFLNNLDDFIAPSQACVNPLVSSRLSAANGADSKEGADRSTLGRIILSNDLSKSDFDELPVMPNLIKSKPAVTKSSVAANASSNQQVATVSLNDCLACSGCVTSAEAVLIQEQSYEKLLRRLGTTNGNSPGIVVVALSPNSTASIAQQLQLTYTECFLKIAALLKSLGVKYVLDASAAGDVALIEAREEFLRRFTEGRRKSWVKPSHTTALSTTVINRFDSSNSSTAVAVGPVTSLNTQLPVLTSHCPGWVCYAEKSQPQALPYLSSVKSAQQILGSLIKFLLVSKAVSDKSDLPSNEEKIIHSGASNIFIVSVQPCFDKKLESSRLDFYHNEVEANEIDLVLSTTELWRLIEETAEARCDKGTAMDVEASSISMDSEGVAATAVAFMRNAISPDTVAGEDCFERLFRSFSSDGCAVMTASNSSASGSSSGSGGYADYIFRYAAYKLYGIDLSQQPLQFKEGRNTDIAELDLSAILKSSDAATSDCNNTSEAVDSTRKLKFGRAYGFRNIQSIMIKLRKGTCDWDLIEIMACPNGCNNGGGQLRHAVKETPTETRHRVVAVEDKFHAQLQVRSPDDSPLVQHLYEVAQLKHPLSQAALELLHTRFHSVPKLDILAPLATKW